MQNVNILASICSLADWIESGFSCDKVHLLVIYFCIWVCFAGLVILCCGYILLMGEISKLILLHVALFHTFNEFINTGTGMLDSIYRMTQKLLQTHIFG